jgi:hypothetical protein
MLCREEKRMAETLGAFAIMLHEVIRHSLRRLRPDARKRAQRVD